MYYVYEHQSEALDRGLDTGPASHGVYAVEGQIAEVFKKTQSLKDRRFTTKKERLRAASRAV